MPDYFVESLFKDRMPDAAKLRAFGFSPAGGKYLYSTDIMDGQFRMCVTVARNGEVGARLVEISFNEEYSLHLVSSAGGQFVGRVKEEYGRVLADISEKCFERNIFKSAVAKKVIAYVRKKYGDEPEYLWEKFPSNAVFRRKDNRKWYGAILTVQKNRLGLEGSVWRMNDDGEPSSTAGRPILGQIQSAGLSDILIVVVRYFGGIKLGVPGLINAYRSAAADAVSNGRIVEKTAAETFAVTFDYTGMDRVMRVMKDMGLSPLRFDTDNVCRLEMSVRLRDTDRFIQRMTEAEAKVEHI